jgi:hypothetical protein
MMHQQTQDSIKLLQQCKCSCYGVVSQALRPFLIFLIHRAEISDNNEQTSGSEARETWQEMSMIFAYKVSLSLSAGSFNMP